MNEAWAAFEADAGELVAQTVENQVNVHYPRVIGKEYCQEFLERMKELDPKKDTASMKAGELLMYKFLQIRRDKVKELSPLHLNLNDNK